MDSLCPRRPSPARFRAARNWFHSATTIQPHCSARTSVSSRRPWPACPTPPHPRCWFFLSESRQARLPLASQPIQCDMICAFVSLTCLDLKAHRACVIARLSAASLFVDPMEQRTVIVAAAAVNRRTLSGRKASRCRQPFRGCGSFAPCPELSEQQLDAEVLRRFAERVNSALHRWLAAICVVSAWNLTLWAEQRWGARPAGPPPDQPCLSPRSRDAIAYPPLIGGGRTSDLSAIWSALQEASHGNVVWWTLQTKCWVVIRILQKYRWPVRSSMSLRRSLTLAALGWKRLAVPSRIREGLQGRTWTGSRRSCQLVATVWEGRETRSRWRATRVASSDAQSYSRNCGRRQPNAKETSCLVFQRLFQPSCFRATSVPDNRRTLSRGRSSRGPIRPVARVQFLLC